VLSEAFHNCSAIPAYSLVTSSSHVNNMIC
jgi:hypothetical protein